MSSFGYRGLLILAVIVPVLTLCSCSSGGAPPPADIGGGEPAATIGEISGGQPNSGGSQPVSAPTIPPVSNLTAMPVAHESADAPLGTNPAYNVEPVQSTVLARSAAHAVSELDALEGLRINWVSVAMHDVPPVPDQAVGTFCEGDLIDLWVDYEVRADLSFTREWLIEGAGLQFAESGLCHDSSGVYSAKLEFLLPYTCGGQELTFQVNTSSSRTTSVFVGIDLAMDDSREMNFVVLETPGAPGDNYPPITDETDVTGLFGGHFDVDTSSFISIMRPLVEFGQVAPEGSTDAHVHRYDNRYNVTGVDYFHFHNFRLHEITEDVPDGSTKFKIIIANADLSTGGRLFINEEYSASESDNYIPVTSYDNTSLSDLPIYSFDGVEGSIPLTELGMYFAVDAIPNGGLHPTNTGSVRANQPGANGEWRNGALTIQAVLVNPDGTDAFTTDTSLSAGGVQGVATSGLLWESTLFWHWKGPSYHMLDWATFGGGRNVGSSQMAMMAWEDELTSTDYDYNDLITTMDVLEYRNGSDQLVQIDMLIKALARGTVHDADWQLNIDAAFPGVGVVAYVNQYYDDGDKDYTNDLRHGPQRIWRSSDGASVPIFSPTREALPVPPEGTPQTNTVAGTTWVEGDYALVTIILGHPMSQGSYTPMPYQPELRVAATSGQMYQIGLWTKSGDPVDDLGRPLGFIVPDQYAWPQEGVSILNVYPEVFPAWIDWITDPLNYEEPCALWYHVTPVGDYCDQAYPTMFN